MSLSRGPNSPPPFARIQPPPRPKEGPVLAVGGRALVTAQGSSSDRVTLTDDGGTSALATIPDGVEVEIVAWRPRRGATRYRVVSPDGRFDGWVGAANLKACPAPPPPAPKVVATPEPPSRPALPIRAARATTARTRNTPALAEAPAIKAAARGSKNRRVSTR